MVQSLTVFPGTIAPGDSALVTCIATDADGDSLMWFWYGYGRITLQRDRSFDGRMVVHADSIATPLDTAGVYCEVYDHRGGAAHAGPVQIILQR